jgi:hypothetical protein
VKTGEVIGSLADGSDHINVKLTGPLEKDGGRFRWYLNQDITKTKLRIKKVKGGFNASLTFHIPEKAPRCWACLRLAQGKKTTVKHICGKEKT